MLPRHLVLVNTECSAGCPGCAGIGWGPDADIPSAVARACEASALVYLGCEALDGSPTVGAVLACLPPDVTPVLITHGAGRQDPAELAARVRELHRIRPVQVVYALDPVHFRAAGLDRVRAVLRVLQAGGAQPKLVFAVPAAESDGLPAELLGCEEVSRGCELVGYRGDRLWRADGDHELYRVLPRARRTAQPAPDPRHLMRFHALVLETTYLCNAACAHCYTSSGPHADRRRLSVADLTRVIDEAADLANIAKRVHVAGGESTIFWREMLEVLGHAAGRGFTNSITTNGFWASSPARTRRRLAQLADVGVRRLELSVDAMHQEFVPRSVVTHLLDAVPDHPIHLVLRVTTTRRQSAATALAHLPVAEHHRLHVFTGAAHASGRAATAIPDADFWRRPGLPDGSCADVLNLSITPDGDVFPCCAGSELCPSLRMGNIGRQSLVEIMDSTRRHFLLRTLVHAGPGHFAKLIAGTDLAARLRPGYEDICDLCSHMFSDPDLSAAVQAVVDGKVAGLLAPSPPVDAARCYGSNTDTMSAMAE